ncbi:hypothetical protein RRV45_01120 [Bacillus sp. DTU_2020_1000418_1_SI_GHA_SEK_038]|uniref:hypothetical protein n=1 Tax=Bacillus sp. DTU_2020_1000418_1_SI_GHA_SEK_038 TaxID=3077585 RepID=UPI0028ECB14D|nr:hypothetical protein [Bacillus sp. DTU_2020_1000418_1_SI_GHA_SEK_038]WNS75680.1 hypothetical protein RRV45_01120 [Bacillus sp. DTU_2020_1000418_1_SI_GHA_SEK_038]
MTDWEQFTEWIEHLGTGSIVTLYVIIFGGLFLLCINALVERALKDNIKNLIISKYIYNYCVLFLLVGSIILGLTL